MFRYSAKMLNHAARLSRAKPAEIVIRVNTWPPVEFTGEQWLAWFRAALMVKITAADPRTVKGRKAGPDYQLALDRLRPYVGTRLVIEPDRLHLLGPRVAEALRRRVRGAD